MRFRHSLLHDITIFFTMLWKKPWLDREGYLYSILPVPVSHSFSYAQYVHELQTALGARRVPWRSLGINVLLTRLGTYGDYRPPSTITINVARTPDQAAQTIIHEIAHLMVYRKADSRRLSHDAQERIADELERELSAGNWSEALRRYPG